MGKAAFICRIKEERGGPNEVPPRWLTMDMRMDMSHACYNIIVEMINGE